MITLVRRFTCDRCGTFTESPEESVRHALPAKGAWLWYCWCPACAEALGEPERAKVSTEQQKAWNAHVAEMNDVMTAKYKEANRLYPQPPDVLGIEAKRLLTLKEQK